MKNGSTWVNVRPVRNRLQIATTTRSRQARHCIIPCARPALIVVMYALCSVWKHMDPFKCYSSLSLQKQELRMTGAQQSQVCNSRCSHQIGSGLRQSGSAHHAHGTCTHIATLSPCAALCCAVPCHASGTYNLCIKFPWVNRSGF